MVDRSKLMKAAWARYRQVAFKGRPFNADTFASVLRFEWKKAKADAVYARVEAERVAVETKPRQLSLFDGVALAAAPKPMSEMERRIDALKYLPFRYSASAAEAAIRAEYGSAA